LSVRVRDNEIDPFKAAFNHLIDRVTAATTNTDNLDVGSRAIIPIPKRLINH
jgi:hypothetical protein